MLGSINVADVFRRHLDGFQDLRTGKLRRTDLALHYGTPIICGAAWLLFGPSTDRLGNLVAGLAVLTGLFLGLLIYVFELRLNVAEKVDYQRSTTLIGLIDILFHNTVYATLAGGLATVAAVLADLLKLSEGWPIAVVVALGAHLVLTTVLIIRRASAAYLELVKDKRRSAMHR